VPPPLLPRTVSRKAFEGGRMGGLSFELGGIRKGKLERGCNFPSRTPSDTFPKLLRGSRHG